MPLSPSVRRTVHLLHRWAGIVLGLLVAAWFLSGLVMLYVGYPRLLPEERLAGLPDLPRRGLVSVQSAWAAAGSPDVPVWRLVSVAGEPRYVFGQERKRWVTVDARTGQRLGLTDATQAQRSATHFAHGAAALTVVSVQEDAWTHSRALDGHRPLWRVAMAEPDGRWLYVSSQTGEVVRDATPTERTWGWVGAWLHWLYLFRGGAWDSIWTGLIIGLSLACTVLVASGLLVGIWRWRFQGRYRSGSRSPYRAGWMRWHHLLGLSGGVLALTWLVSGLLSVNPWQVFDVSGPSPNRAAWTGGPPRAADAPDAQALLAQVAPHARWVEWRRVLGQPRVVVHTPTGVLRLDANGRTPPPLTEAQIVAGIQAMLPAYPVRQAEWVRTYDAYYMAREEHTMTGDRARPLPVLRVHLDDPSAHALTVDPVSGELLQISHRGSRAERWLFGFLHSFDLPALLDRRPLWDFWMLGAGGTGLALSLTGCVLAWRRLRR